MREILFRGKAINRNEGYHRTKYKNGDWVYGLLTRLYDERFEFLPVEMTNTDGISGIEIDYKTVGQYTGLTDKNGTKIFEGDICSKFSNYQGKRFYFPIIFEEGLFFAKYSETAGMPLCDICEKIEVIGNIHDNPELLGGAK